LNEKAALKLLVKLTPPVNYKHVYGVNNGVFATTGMWSSSFYLGSFAGPTFSGILVDNFGFPWTTMLFFFIYCIMIAAGGIELAVLTKIIKSEAKPGYQKLDGITITDSVKV
jgi:MFS family permease